MATAEKLGQVVERGGERYIVTSTYHTVIDGQDVRLNLLTPIPDGHDALGLGRSYRAAILEGASLPLILARLSDVAIREREAQEELLRARWQAYHASQRWKPV